MTEINNDTNQTPHKRRVRYSGTHPRSYKEKYKELNPEKYGDTIEKVIRKGGTPAGMHIFDHGAGNSGFSADFSQGCRDWMRRLAMADNTRKMLEQLKGEGHLYALDVDPIESEKTKARLAGYATARRY